MTKERVESAEEEPSVDAEECRCNNPINSKIVSKRQVTKRLEDEFLKCTLIQDRRKSVVLSCVFQVDCLIANCRELWEAVSGVMESFRV